MIELDDAYRALHPGTETPPTPYAWQRDLHARMLSSALPDQLDIPTGLGKTAVIGLWLLARAMGGPVPRRLVYVVDRRAVVDQATEVAERLAAALGDGREARHPQIEAVRSGLGLGVGEGLLVSTLRGQFVDNEEWLKHPERPAIVVGTVDMIGSRLLFGGYGVSPKFRAAHAAGLGIDTWIVLDEAHLVPPFEALVRSVAQFAGEDADRSELPVPAVRVLSLSATGRSEGENTFQLEPEHLKERAVKARVEAPKHLTVHSMVEEKGVPAALARLAVDRAGETAAVVVYCNSREAAREVARAIGKQKGQDRVMLLVGERRVWERQHVKSDPIWKRFDPDRKRDVAPTGPAFLVATAAGEVGVDLDADHLVCDLVPWERMVQRFGRVNRRKTEWTAHVDVVPSPRPEKDKDDAPVTSEAFERWQAPFASERWKRHDDGTLDASPGGLQAVRDAVPDVVRAASSPGVPHPALTRPTLEAWAMTSLKEHPGRPLVAPWLRGWTNEPPQTRVVWRTTVPVVVAGRELSAKALKAFFEAASPATLEGLDAPTWRVAKVLQERASAAGEAAIHVVVLGEDGVTPFRAAQLAHMKTERLEAELAGRTVIVDAALGGLDADGLLDDGAEGPPSTLDTGDAWDIDVPFQVREVDSDAPIADDFRVDWTSPIDPEETRELRVEVRRTVLRGNAALTRFAQVLGEHHAWTRTHAERIARGLGLDPAASAVVVESGFAHDAGKARDLWQRAMGTPPAGGPWAKSGRVPGEPSSTRRANPRALAGYRHEFGSLRDAQASPVFASMPANHRELAFHLVVAHHGYGRPVIRPFDPDAPPSHSTTLAQEVALRFHGLQGTWGPWGLAWWEWLVRASDWAASAELDARPTGVTRG